MAITQVFSFIPDPTKSQAPMTGTKVFKKGTGADVNATGWKQLCVNPSADSMYYYNADSTKTKNLKAGVDNIIWFADPTVTQVTLTLGAATAYIQGA